MNVYVISALAFLLGCGKAINDSIAAKPVPDVPKDQYEMEWESVGGNMVRYENQEVICYAQTSSGGLTCRFK